MGHFNLANFDLPYNAKRELIENYGPIFDRLNAGETFRVAAFGRAPIRADDIVDPFLDNIILSNGGVIPLPFVLKAAGVAYKPVIYGETITGQELAKILKNWFGDQFLGLFSLK